MVYYHNPLNMSVSHQQKHSIQHRRSTPGTAHKKGSPTAASFMAIVGLLFGLSFGWFTSGNGLMWSFAGGLAGTLIGFLFGRGIDRSLRK
jgi:hypothetical protein